MHRYVMRFSIQSTQFLVNSTKTVYAITCINIFEIVSEIIDPQAMLSQPQVNPEENNHCKHCMTLIRNHNGEIVAFVYVLGRQFFFAKKKLNK